MVGGQPLDHLEALFVMGLQCDWTQDYQEQHQLVARIELKLNLSSVL